MKTALKISLVSNVGLLAGLIFVSSGLKQPREAAPVVAAAGTKAEAAAPLSAALPPATPIAAHVEPVPFRWSQLWAKDYHIYVKNLRAAGCPEATVRAIVTADVHALFEPRAEALQKELSDLAHGSWSAQLANYDSEQALKARLCALPDQEAAEVADLLGLKPAPVEVAATIQPVRRRQRPVSPPLAFQNVDLSALNLSDNQKQAIANIQADFLQRVGGVDQDPNDPAYQARWRQAQPEADNMLMAQLGANGYAQYQALANQSMSSQAQQQ